MRQWLKSGGTIPEDQELYSQLTNLQYAYNVRNEIQLERKEDMKKRGLSSPDIADALAITFAQYVAPHQNAGREGPRKSLVESEYDPFAHMKHDYNPFSRENMDGPLP